MADAANLDKHPYPCGCEYHGQSGLKQETLRLQARVEALEKALEIPLDDVGRIMHESWSKTKRAQGFHHLNECIWHTRYPSPKPLNESCGACHPDLVPWAELPEAQKDINRHAFDAVLAEIKRRAAL